MTKVKLFCLPNAGGSAMYYNQWKKNINKLIEIVPLELSGRGKHMSDCFYNDFQEAINDLAGKINSELDGCQFAFWGHSMGSLLAFELAHKIIETKKQEPIKLFLSGKCPPHIVENKKNICLLSDKDFIEEVMKYGGIPNEILQEKELMKIILPILRADFKILENYDYVKKTHKLNCDIIAFTGRDDKEVKYENLVKWRNYTNGDFCAYEFKGGHFFINNNTQEIIDIIEDKIFEI